MTKTTIALDRLRTVAGGKNQGLGLGGIVRTIICPNTNMIFDDSNDSFGNGLCAEEAQQRLKSVIDWWGSRKK